jgi:hypothetical protein
MNDYKRGTDSSKALTEVRTVLSRAETALKWMDRELATEGTPVTDYSSWEAIRAAQAAGKPLPTCIYRVDVDLVDMIERVQETVRSLDKYRRTPKGGRVPRPGVR